MQVPILDRVLVADLDPVIENLYRWSDVSGVLLMGVIGGTIARHRGYDIVGFFFIAMFSALGGGMIRDVLINRGTVAAMSSPEYLYLAFAGALIARFVYFKGKIWEHFQAHGDAIVSGLWAATGTVKALSYGLPFIPCVMMGVFTATGGSMIRDVVTGRVPQIFGGNQPIVIPAVACALIVLGAQQMDVLAWGMVLGPVVSIFLTLLGYWAGWRVDAREDWAPVNDTAAQLAVLAKKAEAKSRNVGRKLEPMKIRSWRHRQMEKALQRRIEAEVRAGKRRSEAMADADEFLEEFSVELAEIAKAENAAAEVEARKEEESGIGVDLTGDSYDDYDESRLETTTDVQVEDHRKMLDLILADEKLTDELVSKLMKKYEEKSL